MSTTETSRHRTRRQTKSQQPRPSAGRRALRRVRLEIDAEIFGFRNAMTVARRDCAATPGQSLVPRPVAARRRALMVVRVALKMLGLAVFGCVVVVAVVFMWGLLAFIVGIVGGRLLVAIWSLIATDASHLERWLISSVAVLFLLGTLAYWVYDQAPLSRYRVERVRRAFYELCWEWVEAGFEKPAEPEQPETPSQAESVHGVESNPPPLPATRSLTFPSYRSFGVVYHRPPSDHWGGREDWWPGARERFCRFSSDAVTTEATGTVTIPAGQQSTSRGRGL